MAPAMTVYITVGIPGCGKSTYIETSQRRRGIIKATPRLVLSSDAIRHELTGDMSYQGKNGQVFKLLHERLEEAVRWDQDVIVDATNLKPSSRANLARIADWHMAERIAWLFTTPIDICLLRNRARERVVPDQAMERMAKQFEQHCTREILEAEGWKVEEVTT